MSDTEDPDPVPEELCFDDPGKRALIELPKPEPLCVQRKHVLWIFVYFSLFFVQEKSEGS